MAVVQQKLVILISGERFALSEVRIITNQFAPEYGRAAGSVVNVITKSGTNTFHGSAFWFHNNNHLNTLSSFSEDPRAWALGHMAKSEELAGTGEPVWAR